MENSSNIKESSTDSIQWVIPEYEKHNRGKYWYIGAIAIALLLIIISFNTGNINFIFLILLATLVMILHDGYTPQNVLIEINGEGITIGRKFFDFDEIKNFSVIYKPKEDIKNLYFEFNNVLKQRLSIPLKSQDPLSIRKYLLQYLHEDLDRTDSPLSEKVGKILKL